MSPLTARFATLVGTSLALLGAAPAHAGEVLRVEGDRVVRVEDPFVSARGGSDLGPEPRARRDAPAARAARAGEPGRARASATARERARALARRRAARARRALIGALRAALRRRQIASADHARYLRLLSRARRVRKRLRGTRGRELGSVIGTLESIALRRQLTASRMPALFLILQRNTQFWPRRTFPANGDTVTFRGSELVFEYYAGRGLQLQPLVNFKKANLMHGACVKTTGQPCRPAGLRRLLDEMVRTSARRGGFRAWEYYFNFGGGRPPWISGMAQAVGMVAFTRASQLLGDPGLLRFARESLGAFSTPAPVGVATRGPLGGTHYLQYSFARRLYIINAFISALGGLHYYATTTGDLRASLLYAQAEPEARAEVPYHDTGDWSTYSFGGRESTREYHELLREVLAGLCNSVRVATYCDTARRFRLYMTQPAELALLGPTSVTKGVATPVRFSLSKLAAVQVTITRDGRTALDKVATFRRGTRSFAWTPGAAGTYQIRLAAKELRTGRGLRTRVSGVAESVAAP
jgi:D-glucuronyl C5-epimerase C-terminus